MKDVIEKFTVKAVIRVAERRMFAKTIVDSDAFLEMPQSTQLLYFHLSMRADDDGFINKPKTIIRMVGCKDDDLRILITKKFIIPFETGIVVIKHWKIHNYIQNDRYNETKYKEEKAMLTLDENKAYKLENNECIHNVYITDTQYVDTQVRLDKDSIDKDNKKICHFVPPTLEEIQAYCKERNNQVDTTKFRDFYESKGWMVGKTKMKDWKASVRTWERSEIKKSVPDKPKPNKFNQYPQRTYTDQDMADLERKLLNKGVSE